MIIILISKEMLSEPLFSEDDFSSQRVGSWDRRVGKTAHLVVHISWRLYTCPYSSSVRFRFIASGILGESRCCFLYTYAIFYVFGRKLIQYGILLKCMWNMFLRALSFLVPGTCSYDTIERVKEHP